MAHAFTNTGFETAGAAPGLASGWSFVYVCTAEEFAAYDATTPEAVEDFEEEWGNSDLFWTLPPGALAASYDSLPPEAVEDFEEEWSNTPHVWTLSGGASADYDAVVEAFEDFEEEWAGGNQDDVTIFGLGDLTAAVYDFMTPTEEEDFEEEWSGNEGDISEFAGPELVWGSFDGESFEDFEETDLRMHTVEVLAVGADGDKYTLTVNGSTIEYLATGVGTVDTIRDILLNKVNAAGAGAVASTDGTGKIKLRATVSGDPLTVKVSASGTLAEIELLDPPDKSLYWTQSGEIDL